MAMARFSNSRVGDQSFTIVTGYDDVRRAARDWARYTSATPFRVPIPEESDLRPVQQFPIETDPPAHAAYRAVIAPRFSRSAAESIRPLIDDRVDRALRAAGDAGRLHVVDDLALPVVATAIAATLGRVEDAPLLASWGVHVFRDRTDGARRRNAALDDYLAERVDTAIDRPGADLFGDLARARVVIEDVERRLTRDEMLGVGYLVLAGGRDTVISAIVGALWYLATRVDERRALHHTPDAVPAAVEELLRYFSPLAYIGRTVATTHEIDGHQFAAGDLIALGFAAANHDPAAFDDPETIRLDRSPNRHVAFGHGPHTCIGAPLARMQLESVVRHFVGVDAAGVAEPSDWSPSTDREISTVSELPTDLTLAIGHRPDRRIGEPDAQT